MPDQPVGEIMLQGSSKLVFSVNEWRGRQFASVRKFVATQKYQGPTKSGITLNKNLLHELIGILTQLENTLPHKDGQQFKRITKSDTEYIKIEILPTEDEGEFPAVDIREFVDSPNYQGPTKRGVRFRWNLLPEVLACMREQAKIIHETEKKEPSLFGTGAFASPTDKTTSATEVSQADRLTELLGEGLKQFPDDFLDGTIDVGMSIELPDRPLRLDQDNTGTYYLKTDEGLFAKVSNPTEANFIIYAQLRNHRKVSLPKEMIHIFRTVKAYENYLRMLRSKLFAKFLKETCHESVANYETDKLFRSLGFPKLAQ